MNISNRFSTISKSDVAHGSKEKKEDKNNLMQNSINKLISMIEHGAVPEYGNYSAINSIFHNNNKKLNASDVILSVEPSILLDQRPKERELNIKVYSKNKARSYSVTLYRGETSAILNELKGKRIPENITAFIKEASSKFNEYD